jgi:hypothetical protein
MNYVLKMNASSESLEFLFGDVGVGLPVVKVAVSVVKADAHGAVLANHDTVSVGQLVAHLGSPAGSVIMLIPEPLSVHLVFSKACLP